MRPSLQRAADHPDATAKGFARFLQALLTEDGEGLLPPELFKAAIADSIAQKGLSIPTPMYTSTDPQSAHSLDTFSHSAEGSSEGQLGWNCLQLCVERRPVRREGRAALTRAVQDGSLEGLARLGWPRQRLRHRRSREGRRSAPQRSGPSACARPR